MDGSDDVARQKEGNCGEAVWGVQVCDVTEAQRAHTGTCIHTCMTVKSYSSSWLAHFNCYLIFYTIAISESPEFGIWACRFYTIATLLSILEVWG